ncbi:hypothetical protein ASZ90_011893 [hydrocarbon metagenome]|uniref:Uncharacterized protein n=1 Tax=hydrocarbon metagenome TaxID=938273 RepID=A0A0W8FCQ9_9ZZZZ
MIIMNSFAYYLQEYFRRDYLTNFLSHLAIVGNKKIRIPC